jgi:TfoX/Sxy family transcriptional regulator of competence genes
MPYNEQLAQRIEETFRTCGISFVAKKMMGGLCYMVDHKMCVGVDKDRLMARLDPEIYEASLRKKGCLPMDITGRPLKGFVFISQKAIKSQKELGYWIGKALEYNPKAKSSKKRK